MAITLEGRPQDFTPVYNPVNFYFDSDNKTNSGFRYVFDLYEQGVAEKISETRGAPRPVDGFGESFLSKLLSPLITRKFDPLNVTVQDAEEHYIRYELKVGEEYLLEWLYSDYEFYSGGASIYNGFVQLRQFTATSPNAHPFVIGDQINVIQDDGGALKPILTGLHTIVEIVDDWTVVIDMDFNAVGSGATVGGEITYADNKKLITRDLLVETGIAYNGAFGVQAFRVYDELPFILDGFNVNARLLTTVPFIYKVGENADIWLNFGQGDSPFTQLAYFVNSNGDVFRKSILDATKFIRQFYAGTDDTGLTLISGTAGLIKATTTYYEVYTADVGGNQTSKKYRFEIDRRCRIEETNVLFEDKLGSFIPIMFQLHTEKEIDVERLEYRERLGDLDGGKWTHDTQAEGMATANVTQDEGHLLRSNFMGRAELDYYTELIASPTVFIKLDGVFVSCKLKTLKTTTQGQGKRKIVRKDLSVMLSNQNPVNI